MASLHCINNRTATDLGCGTGVLFPYYLEKSAGFVLGVDLSPEMVRVARGKSDDPRIRIVCGDIREMTPERSFDHCVIYDAFPHIAAPRTLIEKLSDWLVPGGRFTIANGMNQKDLNAHHRDVPPDVARMMPPPEGLWELLDPCFKVDRIIEEDDLFVMSGKSRK